jgi:hypothetical protein
LSLFGNGAVCAILVGNNTDITFGSTPRGAHLTATGFLVDNAAVHAVRLLDGAATTCVTMVRRGAYSLAWLDTLACL